MLWNKAHTHTHRALERATMISVQCCTNVLCKCGATPLSEQIPGHYISRYSQCLYKLRTYVLHKIGHGTLHNERITIKQGATAIKICYLVYYETNL